MTEQIVEVPVGKLLPNRSGNPRKQMRELDDLVASIKTKGILVPLTIEAFGANYRIIAGHRRLAAAQRAGLATLPCIIRRYSDHDRLDAMLIDNIQRNDLDPVEEAEAYDQLYQRGLNQREISERVGKSQSHVNKRLQLLDLPAKDKRLVASRQLSVTEALGYMPVDKGREHCRTCGRRLPKKAAVG